MTDIVSPVAIDLLPDAPLPTDNEVQHTGKAYAMVAAQVAMVPQINAAALTVEQNATAAKEQAQISTAAAATTAGAGDAAMGYRNEAKAARDTVVPAAAAVLQDRERAETAATATARDAQFVADKLQEAADGPVASLGGRGGVLPLMTINGIDLLQSGNLVTGQMSVEIATGAVTLNATHHAQMLKASGAADFSFAADLPSGWHAYIHNPSTADVIVRGADGRASYFMYPGELRLFSIVAESIQSSVLSGFSKVFRSSGNFMKPPGYSGFLPRMCTGGGSIANTTTSGGVAGGGLVSSLPFIPYARLPDTVPIVVGAGIVVAGTSGVTSRGGASLFNGHAGYRLIQSVAGDTGVITYDSAFDSEDQSISNILNAYCGGLNGVTGRQRRTSGRMLNGLAGPGVPFLLDAPYNTSTSVVVTTFNASSMDGGVFMEGATAVAAGALSGSLPTGWAEVPGGSGAVRFYQRKLTAADVSLSSLVGPSFQANTNFVIAMLPPASDVALELVANQPAVAGVAEFAMDLVAGDEYLLIATDTAPSNVSRAVRQFACAGSDACLCFRWVIPTAADRSFSVGVLEVGDNDLQNAKIVATTGGTATTAVQLWALRIRGNRANYLRFKEVMFPGGAGGGLYPPAGGEVSVAGVI